jgi:prepilin-type N-terminal cleavage/methylation domain-containing protein
MNSAYPPDMARSLFCHAPSAAKLNRRGFTILEVLMAVTIAAGVIRVLVPTLMQQVALGEQSNRLTAVEAVVSADLDWFSNYTRLWKMKTGSYSLRTDITMTSSYSLAGVTSYETSAATCTSGLAAALLADGQTMYSYSESLKNTLRTYVPPNEIKIGDGVQDRVLIPVSAGGVSGLNVYRNVNAVGNKIKIFYSLDGANADGLNFSREASLLVEAAAWCDRIS